MLHADLVGGADHPVSCLSFGDSTIAAAQREPISTVERARAAQALIPARALISAREGVLGVVAGKSSDHAGQAALLVYVDEAAAVNVPAEIGGMRTVVIPTSAREFASGNVAAANNAGSQLPASALTRATEVKQQAARELMEKNTAIFGVGVGQSLDNPREAALVIYVDRNHLPAKLPQTIDGVRTRYVLMDRLHVTRSYSIAGPAWHCAPPIDAEPVDLVRQQELKLF